MVTRLCNRCTCASRLSSRPSEQYGRALYLTLYCANKTCLGMHSLFRYVKSVKSDVFFREIPIKIKEISAGKITVSEQLCENLRIKKERAQNQKRTEE